jgi:hypothetical protein
MKRVNAKPILRPRKQFEASAVFLNAAADRHFRSYSISIRIQLAHIPGTVQEIIAPLNETWWPVLRFSTRLRQRGQSNYYLNPREKSGRTRFFLGAAMAR